MTAFRTPTLDIEYRGDPDFVYGNSATANAQPFQGIVMHWTRQKSGGVEAELDFFVNYGKTLDPGRGGAFGYMFYVGRSGRVVQGAPLNKRTNQIKSPSRSQRQGRPGSNLSNSNAIGISLVGGAGGYTEAQVNNAIVLVQALQNHFGLDPNQIFGHGEIQSDRQADEGIIVVNAIRGEAPPVISTSVDSDAAPSPAPNSANSAPRSSGGAARGGQEYGITQRDKIMLDFIASRESRGNYDSVYPGDNRRPGLLTYSINELINFQNDLVKSAVARQYSRSTGVGRYHLTQDQIISGSNHLSLNNNLVIFSKPVQDAMCLEILKQDCQYDEWLNGSVSTDTFQFNLSGQFESIPLPCSQQEGDEDLKRLGRVGSRQARYDCDTAEDMLNDIRATSEGNTVNYIISPISTSGVQPSQGSTQRRISENATAGGRYSGGHAGITQSKVTLPLADNPYQYEPIDPWDDRYDFRLGKKVNDIGINGSQPVSRNSLPEPAEPTSNPGRQTPSTLTSGQTSLGGTAITGTPSELAQQAAEESNVGIDAFGGPGDTKNAADAFRPDDGLTGLQSGSQTGSKSLPTPPNDTFDLNDVGSIAASEAERKAAEKERALKTPAELRQEQIDYQKFLNRLR